MPVAWVYGEWHIPVFRAVHQQIAKSERLEVWVGRANEATQIIWFCRPGSVLAFDRQRDGSSR